MSERLLSRNYENTGEAVTAERFRVDPEDYPLLTKQFEERIEGNRLVREYWNIDRTASEMITNTAGLIAMIDGTAAEYKKNRSLEKPDEVIYLDKSARPVSYLVNMFWEDFSEEKRPQHDYLNIDRMQWFRKAGMELDAGGYLRDTGEKPTFSNFMQYADAIPDEVFAWLRAIFVEGELETDNLEEIQKMPTRLDGKNVLVVDEVASTGSTLKIAQYLLKRAIPEIKSINGDYFWNPELQVLGNGERHRTSVPVWYDADRPEGRGVGDVNEPYFLEQYKKNPNSRTLKQAIGALALSEPVSMEKELGGATRELTREMREMQRDYRDGKVFVMRPRQWDLARVKEMMQKQGVRLAPETDAAPDTYLNIKKAIESRRA